MAAKLRYNPLEITSEQLAEAQMTCLKLLNGKDVHIPFTEAFEFGQNLDMIFQLANFGIDQAKAIAGARAAMEAKAKADAEGKEKAVEVKKVEGDCKDCGEKKDKPVVVEKKDGNNP